MTGNLRIIRPAGTAIAAVLALTSTSLLAQTVTPPPVMPEAAAPQPTAPVFAPAQPMVQPTPSVDERLNAAIAASEAEATVKPAPSVKAAPVKHVAEKKAVIDRPASPKAVAPAEPAMTTQPARTEPAPAPAPVPIEAQPPVDTQATPAPAQTSAARSPAIDPALLWALGGGILILGGFAGTAMMRRRKSEEEIAAISPAVPVEPEPLKPASMPLMAPPIAPRPVAGDIDSRLEAMVAAPPSPENPFKTYGKRMTRAKFLLAQQEKAQTASAMPEPAAPAVNRASPEYTQTVYRFGSDRPGRKSLFNPRTG
ncbi:hypothetical protein [Sphingobium estronivorans]|uniref:hypothetical protein n=1 Tax=Sphingobium estronivorans TaxID=1577690 RepID=UPI001238FDE0|nr:hypothetical protein [Sphingobium estronivorans]